MNMKNWLYGVITACLCLTAISCSKDDDSASRELNFVENFKALVMGGKDIDAHQHWSTVNSVSVTINVDFSNDSDYTVYILTTPALLDADATYLAMARLHSGQSKTIAVPKPANTGLLYAACFDSDGHALCQPFPVKAVGTVLTFDGKSPAQPGSYGPTTGNNWSITSQTRPNISTLVSDPERSIYVTGTWILDSNQSVPDNHVVVVADGGRVIVPEGITLSTTSSDGIASGEIIVLPGGEISGKGTLEFSSCAGTYCYNEGSIVVRNIHLHAGTFYNAGSIGNDDYSIINITGEDGGVLTNAGSVYVTTMTGDGLALENGGYLNVEDELELSHSSRLDDGSYTLCESLTLNGNSDGSCVVYMGNAAYINCLNELYIDNFGVWGPSGSAFTADAVLMFRKCTYCATTDGYDGTYLLDHVELILPYDFPTIEDDGAVILWEGNSKGVGIGQLMPTFSGYYDLKLFYCWMNGNEGKELDVNNYQWAVIDDRYDYSWHASPAVDESRQTCTYAMSPSYSYNYFSKNTDTHPENSCVYYAFEVSDGTYNDFDYNDIVLRVSALEDNGDGSFTSNLQVMCVGTNFSTTLLYDGEVFGNELHAAMGSDISKEVNATTANRVFSQLGELTLPNANTPLDRLPFSVRIVDSRDNTYEFSSTNGTPLFLAINADSNSRWFWPVEGTNIGVAYPLLSNWASNMLTAQDWYDSSRADRNRVVSWTNY